MRSLEFVASACASILILGACSGAETSSASATSSGGGAADRPAPAEDTSRDILTTGLDLDITTLEGTATITLAAASSEAASFEVGDLEITSVEDAAGPLRFAVQKARLDVGVPSTADVPATVIVKYAFKSHDNFDGWMAKRNLSFLWPYFCGNLFPCKSAPADGLTFTMNVTGVPDGLTAVFPKSIPGDAPPYMPAIAAAQFTKVELGATSQGTSVSVWHLPGQDADAATGTAHLRDVFDWYETHLGPYSFGGEVGSVSADWGPGDFGGMEHHPFWHVDQHDLKSEEVNAHEAAHGWFGNGVRLACWEDFVLSEGTVTYLAAHALEQQSVDVWRAYECELKSICGPNSTENTIALPETCNQIDILTDPLWSNAPYYKGAFFYRNVATVIGEDELDAALSEFYRANVGKAARMQELVDHIKSKVDGPSALAIDQLEAAWLKTVACPIDRSTLCL